MARERQFRQERGGLGAVRADFVLAHAVPPQMQRAPKLGVIQLHPLVDWRSRRHLNVGRELLAIFAHRDLEFFANGIRGGLQRRKPRKQLAVVEGYRRQARKIEQNRVVHLTRLRAGQDVDAFVKALEAFAAIAFAKVCRRLAQMLC